MADDLSLLFRLRADNAQAKAVLNDTRAAVAQLRQSFGPQLTQTVTVANKAFSDIGDNLQNFVAQRVPLVGGAIVRVTDGLKSLTNESPKSAKAINTVATSIQSIATQSGKSIPQITSFLTKFVQIEGQTKRNEAAFNFFGGSVDLVGNKTAKFIPELEKAGTALAAVSAESAAAGTSIAAVAGPIGIAVLALAAMAAAAVVVTKEIFALAKASADFQGKLFDLSQQVGISVETLSALEVVARTTGSSVEALAASLGIFQKNLAEASEDADSKAAKAFKKLGVETTDTETALRQTIAALAKMPEGFRQTAAALEVFGRGGKAFLAIAKEAKGDIDKITESLKNAGLVTSEQARIADEFNDQLVLLDVQLRGLGTQAIPVVLDVLKQLSQALKENRVAFTVLQGSVKGLAVGISIPLKLALGVLKKELSDVLPVLAVAGTLLQRITEGLGLIDKVPTKILPGGVETPTEGPDEFKKQLQEQRDAALKLQGVLNFDFAKQQREAQSAIAQAQRAFDEGRSTREELLKATLAGIRKQTQAQIDALQVERRIKLQEAALAKDDLEKQTQIGNQILTIDTQIADKRHQLKERERDERAKFRKEEENNELAHQERLLVRASALDQVKITGIEQQVALRKKAALDGDREIENIELTAIDRAQNLLVKKLELAGKDAAKQKEIKDEIARLNVERTATEQRHSQQRLQIVTTEADIALQLIQAKGEALIATVEALADARVITEQEAERRIAKVRLDALDAEIELAKARGQDTRLLEAQREALQAETERNIEAGRQRDLDNERRYADELERIKERIRRVERDAADEVIRLMIIHFASRRDIIRARLNEDLREEQQRHRQAEETIRSLEQENRESNKTQQEKLEFEKEINRLREAEAERHRLAMKGIKDQAKQDEKEATPLGRLELDIENLKEFASVIENSIVPLGEILTGTFRQVADAIGQTVANWVLLGETGPAVMRKILAQALASIAAEAAVNAIKELALGFATLFFNPAESAAHFTAAGLWASIGVGSALAGRAVAGDLFKQKSAGGGTGSAGGVGSSGELNPLNLARNAGPGSQQQIADQIRPIQVQITVNDGKFARAITAHVVDDINNAGPIREVINGDGNLNRG